MSIRAKLAMALATIVIGYAGAARAAIDGFYGNWVNPASDASGIRHVIVSPAGGNRASMRVYGDCHPGECNWGVALADTAAGGPKPETVTAISVLIHYGFAHRRITLRQDGKGGLVFLAQFQYVPGAGHGDFALTGRLDSTGWAGPIGKAEWEKPQGRDAGWGGGNRGTVLVRPKDVCTLFDPQSLRLERAGNGWNIAAGNETIIHTGWGEREARRALAALRHYRFDRKCHTGTMEFWKAGEVIPAGTMSGADCTEFAPTTAHVVQIGKSWQVVDGTRTIADLGISRDNAYAVLALIRYNRLEKKCAVAWPNPVMIYWLSG
jgi:hypothetical protein